KGHVTQVMGPVVDVKVDDDKLPAIYSALEVKLDESGSDEQTRGDLTLEVARHLGDNSVRTIARDSTAGIKRGMSVEITNGPLTVPVGQETLGRVFNLLGDNIDLDEPLPADVRKDPIHRESPKFENLTPDTQILETGIKVVDLLAPY